MGNFENIDTIVLVGMGLIGGSILKGIKESSYQGYVYGLDKESKVMEYAFNEGLIKNKDKFISPKGKCLIVFCVPALSLEEVLKDLQSYDFHPQETIYTDTFSAKTRLLEFLEANSNLKKKFVIGHPIAGSEQHGIAAADPNLFEKHRVILTPVAVTDPVATDRVRQLWQDLGSTVIEMSVEHHDSVLAQTSHLPHLLAYALVDSLSLQGDSMEVFQYAAGGFRDFSRIAASDPVMWRDIFKANGPSVLAVLDRFLDELDDLRRMIADGDVEALQQVFQRAKEARDCYSEQYSE